MLLVKVKLKKCELFSPGYFGERRLGDREISRKYTISVQYRHWLVYKIAQHHLIFTQYFRIPWTDWRVTCK
jgi:hypothetical protein